MIDTISKDTEWPPMSPGDREWSCSRATAVPGDVNDVQLKRNARKIKSNIYFWGQSGDVQNDRGQLEDFSNDNFLMASWSRQTKYQWQWQKILLVLPLVNLTLDLSDSWIYKSLALLEDLSRLKLFSLAVPSDSFISVTFKSFGSGHKWQSK